jgi:hypothetical protein
MTDADLLAKFAAELDAFIEARVELRMKASAAVPQAAHDKRIASLLVDVEKLTARNADLLEQNDQLTTELSAAVVQLESLQLATKRIGELEMELANATTRRVEQRCDELAEIGELKREVHTLRGELHGRDLEIGKLNAELHDERVLADRWRMSLPRQESGLAIGDTATRYNEDFWKSLEKSADLVSGQPEWTQAGIALSDNFVGGSKPPKQRVFTGLTTAQARQHKAKGAVITCPSYMISNPDYKYSLAADDTAYENENGHFIATYPECREPDCDDDDDGEPGASSDPEQLAHGAISARAERA